MTSAASPSPAPISTPTSSYRFAGWSAIGSGAIGIIAAGFLIAAVTARESVVLSTPIYLLFRLHDAGIAIQFLLMIPVARALYDLSCQSAAGISRETRNAGIGALALTVLILLLIFPKILPDAYYVISQGLVGAWLFVVCLRMTGILSRGLRWPGMVIALALAVLGTVPLVYAILVDPVSLHIPAIDPTTYPDTAVNHFLHLVIPILSFLGVFPLPFWTILLGRRLLRHNRS